MNASAVSDSQSSPVRFRSLFRRTHQLYREHFGTFAGLTALLIVLSTLLTWAGAAAPPAAKFWVLFVDGIVLLVVSALAWGALIWAVAEADHGRPVTVRDALRQARALPWGRIVLTVLLVWALFMGFVLVGGVTLAIAIGVFGGLLAGLPSAIGVLIGLLLVALLGGPLLRWVARLLFLPQVLVLEQCWGMRAIRRTGDLIRGNWWRALLCWLMFAVIEGVLSLALNRWPLLHRITQFFVAPLGGIWVTLFYQAMAPGPDRSSLWE